MKTIDMACIRYLNLFGRVTGIRTNSCFLYNRALVFAVPQHLVSKAIGEQGRNVRQMISIVKKKIKIVSAPETPADCGRFIAEIVSPVGFKSIEVTSNEIIISANRQSKASLIGRDKVRLQELEKITKEMFNKNIRII